MTKLADESALPTTLAHNAILFHYRPQCGTHAVNHINCHPRGKTSISWYQLSIPLCTMTGFETPDLTGELIFYLYFCLCDQRVWHLRQARQRDFIPDLNRTPASATTEIPDLNRTPASATTEWHQTPLLLWDPCGQDTNTDTPWVFPP